MGAGWCRERAARAQDSKSPLDRVIVKCVKQMSPVTDLPAVPQESGNNSRPTQIHAGDEKDVEPISGSGFGWQEVVLKVPDLPPVAPPRKKREKPAALRKSATPVICVEVGTPVATPKIRPLPPAHPGVESRGRKVPEAEKEGRENKVLEQEKKKKVIELEKENKVKEMEIEKKVLDQEKEYREKKVLEPEQDKKALEQEKEWRARKVLELEKEWRGKKALDTEWREKKGDDLLRIPQRASSSASMTSRRSISSLSEATSEKLDNYLKSCRSFGSLKPDDLVCEINQALEALSGDSSDSDVWAGIDDWDLGIADHDARTGTPPLRPTSRLAERRGSKRAEFTLGADPKMTEFTLGGEPKPRRKKRLSRGKREAERIPEPVNFESISQSSVSVIKPSQIPVQDFLRQSSTTSLRDKRNSCTLTVDCGSSFSLDLRQGLAPPLSPQIEIPGTPCSPHGLSRCSSPLPKHFVNVTTPPSSPSPSAWSTVDDDVTHSALLRLLSEYHTAAELLGDEDAKNILKRLGVPESLEGDDSRSASALSDDPKQTCNPVGSDPSSMPALSERAGNHVGSGLSSMTQQRSDIPVGSGPSSITPSLTELEEALSILLERNAGQEEADEEVRETESGFAPITEDEAEIRRKTAKNDDKALTKLEAKRIALRNLSQKPESYKEGAEKEPKQEEAKGTKKMDAKPEITITGCGESYHGYENQGNIQTEEINSSSAKLINSEKTNNSSDLYLAGEIEDVAVEQLSRRTDSTELLLDRSSDSVGIVKSVVVNAHDIDSTGMKIKTEPEAPLRTEAGSELKLRTSGSKAMKSLPNDGKQEIRILPAAASQPTAGSAHATIQDDQQFVSMRKCKTDNDLRKSDEFQYVDPKMYP